MRHHISSTLRETPRQHKIVTSESAFPAMCSSGGRTTKGTDDDSEIFMGCRVLPRELEEGISRTLEQNYTMSAMI